MVRQAIARIGELISRPALRKRVLAPVTFDALVLGTNLITGVIVARALGPSGRGELAAILILVQMATWIFSVGGAGAVAYHQSKRPEQGGRLIGSWLTAVVPLGILAIVVGEILVPTLFGAQSQETVELGRIFLIVVLPMMFGIVFNGILLGDQRFLAYNSVRLVVPAVIATGYVFLLLTTGMSVEGALVVNGIANTVSMLAAAFICLRHHGIGPPARGMIRRNLWYGLRAHTGLLSSVVSGRLDLLIIPAFLSAANVGLYSVATNVGSIIATLTGTVALIALPVAARDKKRSGRTVVRTLHATLLIGGVLGIALLIAAEFALSFVYGSSFGAAAPALRILIPGEVLAAGGAVLFSGLLAADKPTLASAPSVPGALITVFGLLIFLPTGGLETAALVTTISYAVIFVLSLILFRRVAGLSWRQFLRAPPP